MIWKKLPGFPNYSCNSKGQIKNASGHIKTLHLSKLGRVCVTLHNYQSGAGHNTLYHASPLICEAWHGVRPTPDHHASHKDGNPLNCKPSNLIWRTRSEQVQAAIQRGTHSCGKYKKHPNGRYAGLSEETKKSIIKMHKSGMSQCAIAKVLHRDNSTISKQLKHLGLVAHDFPLLERERGLNELLVVLRKHPNQRVTHSAISKELGRPINWIRLAIKDLRRLGRVECGMSSCRYGVMYKVI